MGSALRWQQRFSNLEKAYNKYKSILAIEEMGEIEQMALIQAFEFTFELAWKTLKDYLEENGLIVNSPRGAIRQAFQSGYILNGDIWMAALKKRNETSHLYNDGVLEETARFIAEDFSPVLEELYQFMKSEMEPGL